MTGLGELLFFSALAYAIYQFTPRKRVIEYCIKKSEQEADNLECDYILAERTAVKSTMEKLGIKPKEQDIKEEVQNSPEFRELMEAKVIAETFPEEKNKSK